MSALGSKPSHSKIRSRWRRGSRARPLPDKPVEFDTAEGQNSRRGRHKGPVAPLELGVSSRRQHADHRALGKLRIIRNGVLDPNPVAGVPASFATGESGLPGAVHGLMDIALHPQFSENRFVYLTYTKPLDDKKGTVALARGRWDGRALTEVKDIFVADRGGASRIAFGRDRPLFMTTRQDPQDPNTQGGKVLRFVTTVRFRATTPSSGAPASNRSIHAGASHFARARLPFGNRRHVGRTKMDQTAETKST